MYNFKYFLYFWHEYLFYLWYCFNINPRDDAVKIERYLPCSSFCSCSLACIVQAAYWIEISRICSSEQDPSTDDRFENKVPAISCHYRSRTTSSAFALDGVIVDDDAVGTKPIHGSFYCAVWELCIYE